VDLPALENTTDLEDLPALENTELEDPVNLEDTAHFKEDLLKLRL